MSHRDLDLNVSAEARGARFGGRLFLVHDAARKVEPMANPSSLAVEVDDRYIVITMPGTTFRASYFASSNSPELTRSDWMTEDGDASVSRTDFLELAVKAAHAKARELGWLVDRLHQ